MLPQTAFISAPLDPADRRGAARRVIRIGLDIAETPGSQPLMIIDLSRTGMLLRTDADLRVGEKIRVQLPEAGTVHAEIVRRSGNELGAKFNVPIRKSAVSAVVLASPIDATPSARKQSRPDKRSLHDADPPPVSDLLLNAVLISTALIAGCIVFAIGFLPVVG